MSHRGRTIVHLIAAAREFGKILSTLEHDTAIDVRGWRQNAPGYSSEVEIEIESSIFPPEWHGCEVGLRVERAEGALRFIWHAVSVDGEVVLSDRITRMRSMGRSIST